MELAVRGGYPPVVGLDDEARGTWLRSYVEQLVLRDITELGEIRDPAGLRRLLRAIAEHTAGLVADAELAAAADRCSLGEFGQHQTSADPHPSP